MPFQIFSTLLHLDRPAAHRHLHRIVDGVTVRRRHLARVEHDAGEARDHHLDALERLVVNDEEVECVAEARNDLATINVPLLTGHVGLARVHVRHPVRVAEGVAVIIRLGDDNLIIKRLLVGVADDKDLGRRVLDCRLILGVLVLSVLEIEIVLNRVGILEDRSDVKRLKLLAREVGLEKLAYRQRA